MIRLSRLVAPALAAIAIGAAPAEPDGDIAGATITGAPFSLAAARGDVVIVNFWATWCVPCRRELPALNAFYVAHRAEGLRMVAISMDDQSQARAVAALARGYAFEVARVPEMRIPVAFRPSALPVTLIFDRAGALRFDSQQAKSGLLDHAALDRLVAPLLAESAGR